MLKKSYFLFLKFYFCENVGGVWFGSSTSENFTPYPYLVQNPLLSYLSST